MMRFMEAPLPSHLYETFKESPLLWDSRAHVSCKVSMKKMHIQSESWKVQCDEITMSDHETVTNSVTFDTVISVTTRTSSCGAYIQMASSHVSSPVEREEKMPVIHKMHK